MTDYKTMLAQLDALVRGVPHPTANYANASALLFETLEDVNWAGFYFLEGDILVLGPFQGKTACIEIPMGRGVCGTAAARDETQLVYDVHALPGHIACDSASNAENVLDIDSPLIGRFTPADREGLEAFARLLEETVGPLR